MVSEKIPRTFLASVLIRKLFLSWRKLFLLLLLQVGVEDLTTSGHCRSVPVAKVPRELQLTSLVLWVTLLGLWPFIIWCVSHLVAIFSHNLILYRLISMSIVCIRVFVTYISTLGTFTLGCAFYSQLIAFTVVLLAPRFLALTSSSMKLLSIVSLLHHLRIKGLGVPQKDLLPS